MNASCHARTHLTFTHLTIYSSLQERRIIEFFSVRFQEVRRCIEGLSGAMDRSKRKFVDEAGTAGAEGKHNKAQTSGAHSAASSG